MLKANNLITSPVQAVKTFLDSPGLLFLRPISPANEIARGQEPVGQACALLGCRYISLLDKYQGPKFEIAIVFPSLRPHTLTSSDATTDLVQPTNLVHKVWQKSHQVWKCNKQASNQHRRSYIGQ